VVFDPGFLENLASRAAAGSFEANAFQLVPLTDAERDAHPLNIDYFRLGDLATKPAFRVVASASSVGQ
jgi:hypothetical protein